jgi:NAD+ diphosphatase
MDPAIIVIVEHAGACLLGRQASWPVGRYSTLAGFVEAGESLEAAVRREVAEETGVEVASCHYHSSQPWPFPASLMLGFTACTRGREITLRDGELADARWFTPQDIVAGVNDGSLHLSSPVSISWHLLADWMRERADIDLAQLG